MALRQTTIGNFTWIDVHKPTDDDIAVLRRDVPIHQLAIDEFVAPTVQSRATQYPDGLFLAIHVPLFNVEERATYPAEVDIILTETYLVTGHADDVYQLDAFFDRVAGGDHTCGGRPIAGPAHLLHAVLDLLITSCFPRLDHITRNIDTIEDGVFHGDEVHMVREISVVKRDILNFRRAVMPQRSVLESLLRKNDRFIPSDLVPYLHDLVDANARLWHILESQKETIESLESTNDTLLSTRLNGQMRILTVFSAILLPAALYATFMGITNMDILRGHPYAGSIHAGLMVALSLATLVLFRIRRWI